MDTLETNVAKIHIGNSKQTTTYVATLAERTAYEDCELFAVVGLPLLNPAAAEDCERIASGILGVFRRCYKRSSNENTFEVALGEINDEIGKLASLGQHNWTGKISAVIAARQGNRFYAASTGKASSLLMRDGEFNEITESSHPKHPLKTFDTFSAGKIKSGDVLIVTTAELFNHVSLDRLRNILNQNSLEIAAQEVVRIIEDAAGPEVAFGTLLLQETEPGLAHEEGLQTSDYRAGAKPSGMLDQLSQKARQVVSKQTAQTLWQTVRTASKKRPNVDVKKLSSMAYATGTEGLARIKAQAKNYKNINFTAPVHAFRGFSRSKQFFTLSVAVLLLAVIINVFVARSSRNTETANASFEQQKAAIQKILNDADSKLVFKDDAAGAELLKQAAEETQRLAPTTENQTQDKANLEKQIADITKRIQKTETPETAVLATLSNATNLIVLPNILATATGKIVVSYNTNTKTTEDGTVKTNTDISQSVYIGNTEAVVFDGQGLNVWNYSTGANGLPFFLNVPKSTDLVGLVRYATNNRVYTVDTGTGQVISYLVSGNTLSKPVVSIKDNALQDAQDLAVDGNVYVLTTTGINKYNAGKPVSFTFPALTETFSGSGKLFTNADTKQLYILDTTGRVIISDKTGKLIKVLQSDQLRGATDFTVDEANKTMYLLRGGSLLELKYSL